MNRCKSTRTFSQRSVIASGARLEFRESVNIETSLEELDLGVRLPSADETAEARKILAAAGTPPREWL